MDSCLDWRELYTCKKFSNFFFLFIFFFPLFQNGVFVCFLNMYNFQLWFSPSIIFFFGFFIRLIYYFILMFVFVHIILTLIQGFTFILQIGIWCWVPWQCFSFSLPFLGFFFFFSFVRVKMFLSAEEVLFLYFSAFYLLTFFFLFYLIFSFFFHGIPRIYLLHSTNIFSADDDDDNHLKLLLFRDINVTDNIHSFICTYIDR